MLITVARLKNGEKVALSERVSTSFFRDSSRKVTEMVNRYPNSWGKRLSWIATVPDWNSNSTVETLNNYLRSPGCKSLVINSRFNGERLCLSRLDIERFEMDWGYNWGIL
jgi:hypothetical protein